MRACRADLSARRLGRIATLALAAAALPAAAQNVGAPIPLLPPPPAPATPAPGAPAAPEKPGGFNDMGQQSLAPTDAAWSGGIGPDQGGFPDTMWHGTERGFVAASLPLLKPSTSPVLQGLARRLLLSNATSPAGRDAPDRPSLAAARLDRLLALGDVAGALALAGGLPPDTASDGMDRTRVELGFAAGDTTSACQAVQGGIARYQSVWWQRALIACQTLAGDSAEAGLGLSLLREQKAPPDPVFDALVAGRKIEKLPDPTPMRMVLLAAAKEPLPADALTNAGPAALLAYATSDKAPLERRLAAAERAAALGAMPVDALAADYRDVPSTQDQQVASLKDEKPPEDAKARAILFQVARSNAPAETRAAAMTLLLADAKKRGLFPLAAHLVAPAVGELTPADAPPAFAADAARVLLVTGDYEKAAAWIDAAGAKELVLLGRLGRASGGDEGDAPQLLHDAIAALAGRNAATAPVQGDLLLSLSAAFDEKVGGLDWAPLMMPPHEASMPSAAVWIDQQRAAAEKRLGETVLASVLLVSSGERLSLEPVLLGRAIAGLRAVGLEADARALAIEAAVDAGI